MLRQEGPLKPSFEWRSGSEQTYKRCPTSADHLAGASESRRWSLVTRPAAETS